MKKLTPDQIEQVYELAKEMNPDFDMQIQRYADEHNTTPEELTELSDNTNEEQSGDEFDKFWTWYAHNYLANDMTDRLSLDDDGTLHTLLNEWKGKVLTDDEFCDWRNEQEKESFEFSLWLLENKLNNK